jgi:hypothetical protein
MSMPWSARSGAMFQLLVCEPSYPPLNPKRDGFLSIVNRNHYRQLRAFTRAKMNVHIHAHCDIVQGAACAQQRVSDGH